MVHREFAAQDVFQGVGERPVTDVVQKPRGLHQLPLVGRQLERARHFPRDVTDPEAVLDPRVVRAGEHEVCEAELANRVETLEFERLEEVQG